MPVAIDTSVLVEAEKLENFETLLPRDENGPYYIPALAAAEFLVGTRPPVRDDLRYRASQLYQTLFKHLVDTFTEADAAQLAALTAELKRKGQTMKFFDAAIAASVLARGAEALKYDSPLVISECLKAHVCRACSDAG
jgi:predicted nucleic acid-binding protein